MAKKQNFINLTGRCITTQGGLILEATEPRLSIENKVEVKKEFGSEWDLGEISHPILKLPEQKEDTYYVIPWHLALLAKIQQPWRNDLLVARGRIKGGKKPSEGIMVAAKLYRYTS